MCNIHTELNMYKNKSKDLNELEEYIQNKFKLDCKQFKPFINSTSKKFLQSLDFL